MHAKHASESKNGHSPTYPPPYSIIELSANTLLLQPTANRFTFAYVCVCQYFFLSMSSLLRPSFFLPSLFLISSLLLLLKSSHTNIQSYLLLFHSPSLFLVLFSLSLLNWVPKHFTYVENLLSCHGKHRFRLSYSLSFCHYHLLYLLLSTFFLYRPQFTGHRRLFSVCYIIPHLILGVCIYK